jgi:hypothetical protein
MKTIKELSKILGQMYLHLILILFLGTFITAEAVERGGALTKINVENGLMAAELDSVALKTVLENIKTINGLEYQGEEDVLNEKITMSFDSLSIEEGLMRILSKFNCTMKYDSDGMPISVYIFGKGDNKAGDKRAARDGGSSQIRESRVQQIENRGISTSKNKETHQFKMSTIGPVVPVEITKASVSDNSNSDRSGIAHRISPGLDP